MSFYSVVAFIRKTSHAVKHTVKSYEKIYWRPDWGTMILDAIKFAVFHHGSRSSDCLKDRVDMKWIGLCLAVALLVIVSGCKTRTEGKSGDPVALVRERAERTCLLDLGKTNKTVTFTAELEYPSQYGLTRDEYGRLCGFVNEVFNKGTNFVSTVDDLSGVFFESVRTVSTNENFNADTDLDVAIEGRVVYADSRYFSYALDVRGLLTDHLFSTYDRNLERAITIDDLVPSNRFAQLRGYMRDYLKSGLFPLDGDPFKDKPSDWPQIKADFAVDDIGIAWIYSRDELDLGAWAEVRVGWDDLKNIADPALIPTGRREPATVRALAKDAADWWRFPYTRFERFENTPPCPPFEGTNYPSGSVKLKIESPCQGGMTASKFAALQKCLAKAISPHSGANGATVEETVRCEVVHFWERQIKNWDGKSPDSGYGVYELEAKIVYRGPEYVSFRIDSQDGCPCGAGATNIVWSWRKESPLCSDDLLEPRATNELKRLMRQRVREDLAGPYENNPAVVLPDYAKDWPETFDNFSLDENGVTWFCDAGEILIGGRGPYGTKLTWQELRPCLKKTFSLPTRE